MLLELFEYTIDNYEESLSLLDLLKGASKRSKELIPGLIRSSTMNRMKN